MTYRNTVMAGLVALLPHTALACEPPAIYHADYAPDLQGASNAAVADFVTQATPVVSNVYIKRGMAGSSSMCGGMGYAGVTISMPDGAAFTFGQVGVEVQIVEGRFPPHVFPTGAVMPYDPDATELYLGNVWGDGQPGEQRPIAARFTASFVAPDGTKGPAVTFGFDSVPSKTRDIKQTDR